MTDDFICPVVPTVREIFCFDFWLNLVRKNICFSDEVSSNGRLNIQNVSNVTQVKL